MTVVSTRACAFTHTHFNSGSSRTLLRRKEYARAHQARNRLHCILSAVINTDYFPDNVTLRNMKNESFFKFLKVYHAHAYTRIPIRTPVRDYLGSTRTKFSKPCLFTIRRVLVFVKVRFRTFSFSKVSTYVGHFLYTLRNTRFRPPFSLLP